MVRVFVTSNTHAHGKYLHTRYNIPGFNRFNNCFSGTHTHTHTNFENDHKLSRMDEKQIVLVELLNRFSLIIKINMETSNGPDRHKHTHTHMHRVRRRTSDDVDVDPEDEKA